MDRLLATIHNMTFRESPAISHLRCRILSTTQGKICAETLHMNHVFEPRCGAFLFPNIFSACRASEVHRPSVSKTIMFLALIISFQYDFRSLPNMSCRVLLSHEQDYCVFSLNSNIHLTPYCQKLGNF